MSERLTAALEAYPNLANRALVMLLQDPRNAAAVEEWIKESAKSDIRFARLGEQAGLEVGEWRELSRPCVACGV